MFSNTKKLEQAQKRQKKREVDPAAKRLRSSLGQIHDKNKCVSCCKPESAKHFELPEHRVLEECATLMARTMYRKTASSFRSSLSSLYIIYKNHTLLSLTWARSSDTRWHP